MAYVVLFAIVGLLEIVSAILIFKFKDILHSVLALSSLFLLNSIIFFMLEQPMLALIQLFIMVGGVATYVFVGVSSIGFSKFKHTDYKLLGLAYILLFVPLAFNAARSIPVSAESNMISMDFLSQSLAQSVPLLYIVALLVFGVGIGSIIAMKKMRDIK